MKKTTFILIIFISHFSFSQTGNVRSYYQNVNKAELCIVDSNYTNALELYQTAFEQIEHPFAKDYYNALLCATFTAQNDLAFDYLYKLIHKGIEIDYFVDNDYLKPLQEDKEWKKFEEYYINNKEQIDAGFNNELRVELEKIVEIDQKTNIERINDLENKQKAIAFDSVVLANAVKYKEIIEEYGYPNEELLGIERPNASEVSWVLGQHYFGILKNNNLVDTLNLLPLFTKALYSGQISSKSFNGILTSYLREKMTGSSAYLVDTNIVFLKYSENYKNYINAYRNVYFLDNIEDSQKKVGYNINKIRGKFSTINMTPNEYEKKLEESYKQKYFIIGIENYVTIFYNDMESVNEFIETNNNRILDFDTK